MSNVFDQHYLEARGERCALPLSSGKRRDLFHCLKMATGRDLFLLSSPPKASERRTGQWLPAIETQFSTHPQLVCANWDAPKIRIPASWFFYTRQIIRHARSGDVVLIDNYEIIYLIAAYAVNLARSLTFILEYEDGKHAIDRGWERWLSGAAEIFGRRLLDGAILAHPSLAKRLPAGLPRELIPGFYQPAASSAERPMAGPLRFLYSGTLDEARGVNLIIDTLPLLPQAGWELHVTGSGPLEKRVRSTVADPRWSKHLRFHGLLPDSEYQRLVATCHVALNCQDPSNPISDVTYPSKTFTYFSAGLGVISSRASNVPAVLGDACWYFAAQTPESLADVMTQVLRAGKTGPRAEALRNLEERYSVTGTVRRLQKFFERISYARGSRV